MYNDFSDWKDLARGNHFTVVEMKNGDFKAWDGIKFQGWFGMNDEMEIGGYFADMFLTPKEREKING